MTSLSTKSSLSYVFIKKVIKYKATNDCDVNSLFFAELNFYRFLYASNIKMTLLSKMTSHYISGQVFLKKKMSDEITLLFDVNLRLLNHTYYYWEHKNSLIELIYFVLCKGIGDFSLIPFNL